MINGFEKKNKLICQKKFTDRIMCNVSNMIAECYPNFMNEIDHFGSDSIESHFFKMIKKMSVNLFPWKWSMWPMRGKKTWQAIEFEGPSLNPPETLSLPSQYF